MINIKRGSIKNKYVDGTAQSFLGIMKIKRELIDFEKFKEHQEKVYKETEDKVIKIVRDRFIKDLCISKADETLIQYRTFDSPAPKKHIEMFPIIEEWQETQKDITYVIHATITKE